MSTDAGATAPEAGTHWLGRDGRQAFLWVFGIIGAVLVLLAVGAFFVPTSHVSRSGALGALAVWAVATGLAIVRSRQIRLEIFEDGFRYVGLFRSSRLRYRGHRGLPARRRTLRRTQRRSPRRPLRRGRPGARARAELPREAQACSRVDPGALPRPRCGRYRRGAPDLEVAQNRRSPILGSRPGDDPQRRGARCSLSSSCSGRRSAWSVLAGSSICGTLLAMPIASIALRAYLRQARFVRDDPLSLALRQDRAGAVPPNDHGLDGISSAAMEPLSGEALDDCSGGFLARRHRPSDVTTEATVPRGTARG